MGIKYVPKIKFNRSATIAKIENAAKQGIKAVANAVNKDIVDYLPRDKENSLYISQIMHSDLENGKLVW